MALAELFLTIFPRAANVGAGMIRTGTTLGAKLCSGADEKW